jgi:uncharacterized protein YfeS
MILITVLLFSCLGNNRTLNNTITSKDSVMYDTSIHPLLEIGSYYVYEMRKDSFVGLLLGAISKEDDSIYYSFILSGKFFKNIPSEKEFREAGLWGLEVPTYPWGNFIKSFCRYSISEKNLTPYLNKLRHIGKVNFSNKNSYGSYSGIDDFGKLSGEFIFFEKRNEDTDKQIKETGIPSSKYAVINWEHLIATDNAEEMSKPEVIWVLSAKTAHPKTATLMKEEWWWSQIDDFSPFGNDDGADAFYFFKDWRENNSEAEPSLFLNELEQKWGMSFSHINKDEERDLPSIEKANMFYRNVDRAIIGVAFGQLVLEGKISSELKKLTIKAIKRTKTEFGMNGIIEGNKVEYRSRLNKMGNILNTF